MHPVISEMLAEQHREELLAEAALMRRARSSRGGRSRTPRQAARLVMRLREMTTARNGAVPCEVC